MNGKIALLVLAALPFSMMAKMTFHNCTGYIVQAKDWHTAGLCKKIKEETFDPISVTDVGTHCNFVSAKFSVQIVKAYIPVIEVPKEKTPGDREMFLYAESPIVDAQTIAGSTAKTTPFVRFWLWVTPKGLYKGGLYAVSDWFDTATGLAATADQLNKANPKLSNDKPELSI